MQEIFFVGCVLGFFIGFVSLWVLDLYITIYNERFKENEIKQKTD